jgi:hypothetical protein
MPQFEWSGVSSFKMAQSCHGWWSLAADRQMKHFILFLAILCGVVSFLFFIVAQEAASGAYWAAETCAAVRVLCERPLSWP